ncbi:MAG: DUF1634 domain-containing protein [Thermoprotei archaeon]|jgi:uncharacterized membrane protein
MKKPDLEIIIGYILAIGVITSLVIESLGLTMYIIDKGTTQIDLNDENMHIKFQDFFIYLSNITQSTFHKFDYINIMAFGLAILMLTPYLRVVASVLYFIFTHNYKYVIITLIVLTILTLSLITH